MKDYKDRIRYLISRLYEPADINNFDVKMTTPDIYRDLCTVIPANAFDEFDLVEILEEMGFAPQYESKEREVEKNVVADDGAISSETVTENYDDLRYYWYMRKID